MKIELTEEELREMMVALAHWRAYQISQDRDDTTVKGVLDRLRSKQQGGSRVQ